MHCQPEPTHRFSEPKKDRYPHGSQTEKMIYRPTSEHFFSHPNSNTRSTCSHLFLFSNHHRRRAQARDGRFCRQPRWIITTGKNKNHNIQTSGQKRFGEHFWMTCSQNIQKQHISATPVWGTFVMSPTPNLEFAQTLVAMWRLCL